MDVALIISFEPAENKARKISGSGPVIEGAQSFDAYEGVGGGVFVQSPFDASSFDEDWLQRNITKTISQEGCGQIVADGAASGDGG